MVPCYPNNVIDMTPKHVIDYGQYNEPAVCPHCGRCKHCGQGAAPTWPLTSPTVEPLPVTPNIGTGTQPPKPLYEITC